MNIFEIEQEYYSILAMIEENEGDITPEIEAALNFNRENLREKIKGYTNIIKELEASVDMIKKEKARLSEIQKSKENTIDRLKKCMAEAIKKFGDESKTGTKFIDFGTGKVSVRNTQNLEINDDDVTDFANRFVGYFSWLTHTNTWGQNDLDIKVITDVCKDTLDYNDDDVSNIDADLQIKMSLKDMVSTEKGKALMKALCDYTDIIKVKANIDKNHIKNQIKTGGYNPKFAELVNKSSIIIK